MVEDPHKKGKFYGKLTAPRHLKKRFNILSVLFEET